MSEKLRHNNSDLGGTVLVAALAAALVGFGSGGDIGADVGIMLAREAEVQDTGDSIVDQLNEFEQEKAFAKDGRSAGEIAGGVTAGVLGAGLGFLITNLEVLIRRRRNR